MNAEQSVIGFTEAELGFFLVLLCVVLWAAGASDADAARHDGVTTAPEPPTVPLAAIAEDSLAALRADRERLADAVRVRDSLRRIVDSLRSPIWPSCRSRGVADGPLATLVALGDGRYRIDAETLDVRGVAERTADARRRAGSATCRHEVRLGFRRDLAAPEYERARPGVGALGLRLLPGPQVER